MQNVKFLARLFLKLQENGPLLSARPHTSHTACIAFPPWLKKLLQLIQNFRYWLAEVSQILCGQIMLKQGFYKAKQLSFNPGERLFFGNTMEKFKRIHVNFFILTKKRKRNKTLMMFMLEMTVQY